MDKNDNTIKIYNSYLRYIGGKAKLIPDIIKLCPKISINNLIEPFVGGGSIFINLYYNNIVKNGLLNDNNKWIVNLHLLIKNNPEYVLSEMNKYQSILDKLDSKNNPEKFKKFYYKIREKFNENNEITNSKLMMFLFISKMGFNGVIRFNKDGLCTTAAGHKNLKFVVKNNINNIITASKSFKFANFSILSFSEFLDSILNTIKINDFIYYDPPYLPTNFCINKKDKSFNDYSDIPFSYLDIEKIKEYFDLFNNIKISQMLSINKNEYIKELFKNYNITEINVSKIAPGSSGFIGKTEEFIITNY